MLTVVSFKICPFVQRVTAMLEAKSIPYSVDYISLSDKPQWFLELSPTGQVPLLVTDSGQALFESDAIVEYLDEVTPRLSPDRTPEQRAIDRAWSTQASKHYLVQCAAMQSKDQDTLSGRAIKLNKAFGRVEGQFGAGPFFWGDRLGAVDIAWLPLLHRAAIVERRSGFDFLATYHKLKDWQEALLATGIPDRSVPPDFEDAFSEFYLAEQTVLGRMQSERAAAIDP